jgi:hypothetical protein
MRINECVYRAGGDNKEWDSKSKKTNEEGRGRVKRSKTIIHLIDPETGSESVRYSQHQEEVYGLEVRQKQVSGNSTQSTLRNEDKTVKILRCRDALERGYKGRLKMYLHSLANAEALPINMNFMDRLCQREVHRFDILNRNNLWRMWVKTGFFT